MQAEIAYASIFDFLTRQEPERYDAKYTSQKNQQVINLGVPETLERS
jgi:hypothetical protein